MGKDSLQLQLLVLFSVSSKCCILLSLWEHYVGVRYKLLASEVGAFQTVFKTGCLKRKFKTFSSIGSFASKDP